MFPPTFPSYFLSWPARDSALPFSALANYWGRTGPIRQKMRRMNADLTRLKCANEIRRTILSGCHSLYYFRSGNGLSFPVGRCVTRYWLAWFFCDDVFSILADSRFCVHLEKRRFRLGIAQFSNAAVEQWMSKVY